MIDYTPHTQGEVFRDISLLIKNCHEDYFAQILYDVMVKYIRFDELTQMVYEQQGGATKPFLIHQDNHSKLSAMYKNKSISRDDTIYEYLTNIYNSDPFFIYAQTGQEGVIHMDAIADVDFQNTKCYKLYNQTLNWQYEMACLVRLSDTATYALSFANVQDPFQADHVSMLNDIFPILKQLLIQFWQQNKCYIAPHFSEENMTHSTHQTLLNSTCTEREKQVIALMMSGISNANIAERLGISVLTLKTHRRNIYGKLQVNSPIQLMRKLLKDSQG